eukprot:TRINITY_DN7302_c0_g3_i1.p1 TRINITY_DN7302_c0_g3~~TRINITY_DN7302_c0_g3_i1.p1  ORF type:complete len:114 (-),score=0.54 TRINITY_DN7302_c0_g3_i1:151-492(-)
MVLVPTHFGFVSLSLCAPCILHARVAASTGPLLYRIAPARLFVNSSLKGVDVAVVMHDLPYGGGLCRLLKLLDLCVVLDFKLEVKNELRWKARSRLVFSSTLHGQSDEDVARG